MNSQQPSAEDVARALGGKRTGRGWSAPCPAHEDKNPSLSISEGEDGKVLLKCHAGCEFKDVVAALRRRGIVPEREERRSARPIQRRGSRPGKPPPHTEVPDGPSEHEEPSSVPDQNGAAAPSPPPRPPRIGKPYHQVIPYEYLDSDGKHFTWTYRYEDEAGKRVDTRQTRNEDTPGGPCPLYRLPSLLANSEKPILVCEGEKSADCAQDIFGTEYEATTSKQGAKSPGKSDWGPARGRRVVIWPDADDNGQSYAAAVKDLCLKVGARSVEIVDVEGLPAKWDLADPPPSDEGQAVYERIGRLAASGIELEVRTNWATPPKPRQWLVDGHLSSGRIALLVGEGGIGKTKLALQLCYHIAIDQADEPNRVWFDGGPEITTPASSAVYLSWEDDHDEIHRRLIDSPASQENGGASELERRLQGRFHAIDAGDSGPIWQATHENTLGALTEFGRAIRSYCEKVDARLLVIDALDSAYAASEIERPVVRAFLAHWDTWGRRNNCVPLILAHPGKGEHTYSGSTAWRNGVRTMLSLTSPAQDRGVLAVDKINYAAKPKDLILMNWKWWRTAEGDDSDFRDEDETAIDDEVLGFITANPGASQNLITRSLKGTGSGRKRASLERLERMRKVVVERTRRGNCYTLASEPDPEEAL